MREHLLKILVTAVSVLPAWACMRVFTEWGTGEWVTLCLFVVGMGVADRVNDET